MSSRREPSTPPEIPGYEYVRLLGMGGFADVFLYRQLMPRRPVAVKVLLASSLDDLTRMRFRTEADLMASLSHHPSIVTVFQADVASDGRPFLVMEYCSRPGLAERYRAERMGVAEVLRIGIRLASAVETAHRAGILHRDIKPANVLTTDFGWPALTDFGIAATAGLAAGAAVGMSIPWAPPEMLADEPRSDERSDVYSLAATIYSLLARRSPFELPDGPNGAADLIVRIERSAVASTGRGDVPASLHDVLTRAMARMPERRYPSAIALARALQQVEAELMLPLTPLDLPDEFGGAVVEAGEGEADQATRLRPVRSISPQDPSAQPAGEPVAGSPALAEQVGAAPGPQQAVPPTDPDDVPERWRRDLEALLAARAAEPQERRPRRSLATIVAGAGILAILAAAAVLTFSRPGPAPAAPTATGTPTAVLRAVPSPVELTGLVESGTAVFTWTNPDPEPGDRYLWGVASVGAPT
ncbi:serine/threonine-protein kinase, partial [Actinotalea sp.]|uniref:serine/threonine-protein kinase n=1 Tax=Actinotalea sp. TaxID=1872145 RepID=UPI0035651983